LIEIDGARGASPAPGKPGYSAVAGSFAHDRTTLVALWSCGLARDRMAEARLQWYYQRNPEGVPEIFFLRSDDASRAVGVVTLARRRMRLGTETFLAGVLVDFVVEPQHRSFFPALLLQKKLLRRAIPDHPVVFGTPNRLSEAVVRRAGYRRVGQMVRLARVLRSRTYLSRFLPHWLSHILGAAIDHTLLATTSLRAPSNPDYTWEWRDRPDADFDALWERVSPSEALIGVRDCAFLTWRFVENPLHVYRFFAVVSKADRKLVAYAVCHVHAEALRVADFLVDPGVPGAVKRLWLDLSREAYRRGHRTLSVEFLGSEAVRRQLEALGMVNRGERPLYAAFPNRQELSSPSNWYVTNADEDG
jgi:hypothetical protein